VYAKLVAIGIIFLLLPVSAASAGFYYNSINQEYELNPDKTAMVRVGFEVVNSQRDRVLTGISWTIPGTVMKVKAWDEQGDLSFEKREGKDQTTIEVSFRSPLYSGRSYKFWLEYIAQKIVYGAPGEFRGRFGGFQTGVEIKEYSVKVKGPPGTKLFLTSPSAQVKGENVYIRTSLKAGDSFEGLPVIFFYAPLFYRVSMVETVTNRGKEKSDVLLDVLLYHLSQSQFATLCSSSHPLDSIYVDEENNWHACFRFKLEPGASETIWLGLLWICDIYSPNIGPENSGALFQIEPVMGGYLKEDTWWEVNNPQIQQKANLLAEGETNVFLLAQKIVKGVDELVEYEETEPRQGALQTLERGKGDCDGYSDLSIALARACGLPARLCFGWVAKEDGSFGGHAWVEFYTPTFGWQPADPTWAENWGDYLFKSDPTRLLRGVRGLTSSTSSVFISYFGSSPDVDEKVEISRLENREVLPMLLQACDLLLAKAGELVSPENSVLREARSLYELAKTQGSIDLALHSIKCSNQILSELGKQPVLERRLLPLMWLFVLILVAVGFAVFSLRKR